MLELRGIYTPVVTPLQDDETVDEAALERVLERLLAAGIHGLFLLGSTGEQPALRDAERLRVMQRARKTVGGRVPIVVGTMAPSTARAIDHLREAEREGMDGAAVTPPYYYPSRGGDEQYAHYASCAASCGLPLVIYNIPSTTKVMVAPETVRRIAGLPTVVGIKDSSGDFAHFLRLVEIASQVRGFRAMVGLPPLAGPAVLAGAAGAVPGVSNMDPACMVALYDAAVAGDLARVRALQIRVHRLMDVVTHGAPIACIKTALELLGVCPARACEPLQPVPPSGRTAIRAILEELELLPPG